MSNARHSKDEDTVEALRAQLSQVTAELVSALAQLDRIGMSAVAADGTGPVPVVQGRRLARVPKEARWLKVVPGLALPLGLASAIRRAAGTAHHAALGAPAVSAAALSAAVVVTLGHAHTLPYETRYAGPVPSASSPATPVVVLPRSRLTANTDSHPVLRRSWRPHVKPLAVARPVPVPVPVAMPVPVVTSSASVQGSSQSQSSQSSQSYGLQAQGRHAAQDSGPGDSSYQGRHGGQGNGQGNYWTDGSQQSGTWQNGNGQGANRQSGHGQSANWQGANQQGDQQQGGGWQGSGGGHGNRGGR